eukprot:CAMPEP_0197531168 /NCGR_PEP_ID=MMETSP1318-20131121/34368_1 /TAXON_ID=552666 /ORGANISM="Partenskyella glossopodia, Strain RCC365" /LENGTH=360 /DNA_ID=CAMNT_0043087287 /DNA_START=9 /DNA_END=1091 /DNA_ORIENTATION=+
MSENNGSSGVVKFGIIGCGYISKKWIAAIESAGHQIVAVASRNKLENAKNYQKLCKKSNPHAYDDYDALLEHAGMDAVYFSLPTALRTTWVLKAINKGFHVLVEKPMNGEAEVRKIINAAKENKVQLMDCVMFMHSLRLRALSDQKRALSDQKLKQEIGSIRRVTSSFGTGPMPKDNIRYNPILEPYGALGDLGWYNIRVSLWAFGYDLPTHVSCIQIGETENKAIENVQGWLHYSDGRMASFDCEFNNGCTRQWAMVCGTKQQLYIPNFVVQKETDSFSTIVSSWGDFDKGKFDVDDQVQTVNIPQHCQEAECIKTFAALTKSVDNEFWSSVILKTQVVLDACLSSIKNNGVPTKVASL